MFSFLDDSNLIIGIVISLFFYLCTYADKKLSFDKKGCLRLILNVASIVIITSITYRSLEKIGIDYAIIHLFCLIIGYEGTNAIKYLKLTTLKLLSQMI